jgi:hypothetical protein
VTPRKPGGSQPPFTHDHPDPGDGVWHAAVTGADGAGETGGGDVEAGAAKPGGSHPPLTHVHPAPGDGVRHAAGLGAGAGAGAGEGAGAAGPIGYPGGTHPPFTHVHPVPGDGVAQLGAGGGAGAGAGAGSGAGLGAGATLPVVNIETPCPRSCSAIVRATMRQKYVVFG